MDVNDPIADPVFVDCAFAFEGPDTLGMFLVGSAETCWPVPRQVRAADAVEDDEAAGRLSLRRGA